MTSLQEFLVAKSLHEAETQRRLVERLIALLHGQKDAYTAERRDRLEAELSLAQQRLARLEHLVGKLRQEMTPGQEAPEPR